MIGEQGEQFFYKIFNTGLISGIMASETIIDLW